MVLKKWQLEYDVVDLKEYGIDNVAFDFPSAISYMCEAMNQGYIILGGDIIVFENGRYTESGNSWWSDKKDPQETMKDALGYFSTLCNNNCFDFSWKISVILAK